MSFLTVGGAACSPFTSILPFSLIWPMALYCLRYTYFDVYRGQLACKNTRHAKGLYSATLADVCLWRIPTGVFRPLEFVNSLLWSLSWGRRSFFFWVNLSYAFWGRTGLHLLSGSVSPQFTDIGSYYRLLVAIDSILHELDAPGLVV